MQSEERAAERRPRSLAALVALGAAALLVFCALIALGVWQIERRAWKLDLIERVDARLHASPSPPPAPSAWPAFSASDDEYRRVRLTGAFDYGAVTFTQAATELGAGYWAMTPLKAREGFTVLVNRGFVDPEHRDAARSGPPGETTVTGLLRATEPKGGFLRSNEPAADLWRSRDVAAIAERRGLGDAAPYFVDADATPNPGGWPVGGLTVVAFPNNHLVYALTWFGLALMVAGGAAIVARHEIKARRAGDRIRSGA